jgi:hypothetical protein
MSTARLTEKDVRMFCMDKPELNPLLRGVRWSPEEIDGAIVHAISYFNETPPFVESWTAETFPWRFTLLLGVAGHLLRSASINQASNNLTYSLDSVSVNDMDKSDIFLRLGNGYWEEFKAMVQNIKVAKNISAAFGSVHSELELMVR